MFVAAILAVKVAAGRCVLYVCVARRRFEIEYGAGLVVLSIQSCAFVFRFHFIETFSRKSARMDETCTTSYTHVTHS
jgi:hypothetical protein